MVRVGGRLTGISAGQVASTYAYTPFGDIASIDHRVNGVSLWRLDYTWDAGGHLVERRDTRQGQTYTWAYAYDPAGRLAEVKLEGVTVGRYGYDANGNRVTEDLGAGEQAATVDAQDRLQGCGHRTYEYDPQGRRITADCGGRLARYLYDAQGQRLGRRKNGVLERGWLYQSPLKIAGELDGDNQLQVAFLQGQSPNVPDGMVKGGRRYRLLTDHLGSVGYVVDIDTGEIVQALEHDEWGKVLKDTNPGFQPFGYAGGLYDADTGLVRFGARDYDPREGRWLTKDPIGLEGGYNVYGYVNGNPSSFADPSGLWWGAAAACAVGFSGGYLAGDTYVARQNKRRSSEECHPGDGEDTSVVDDHSGLKDALGKLGDGMETVGKVGVEGVLAAGLMAAGASVGKAIGAACGIAGVLVGMNFGDGSASDFVGTLSGIGVSLSWGM